MRLQEGFNGGASGGDLDGCGGGEDGGSEVLSSRLGIDGVGMRVHRKNSVDAEIRVLFSSVSENKDKKREI